MFFYIIKLTLLKRYIITVIKINGRKERIVQGKKDFSQSVENSSSDIYGKGKKNCYSVSSTRYKKKIIVWKHIVTHTVYWVLFILLAPSCRETLCFPKKSSRNQRSSRMLSFRRYIESLQGFIFYCDDILIFNNLPIPSRFVVKSNYLSIQQETKIIISTWLTLWVE